MPTTSQATIERRVTERRLADVEVRGYLDDLSYADVVMALGTPTVVTHRPRSTWNVDDERPPLADDDPAVMQAIGRCVASRVRSSLPGDPGRALDLDRVHPARCAWCDYPTDELLRALDWSIVDSGYVTSEVAMWEGAMGSSYARELRANVYDNVRWAAFWRSTPEARRALVERAMTG